ncbi:MAG: hypothetical protein M1822_007812 [Bathelium mastoideum]|nr:MAG: hypothetical protein M1822_007812 [Bathelium mastoideum]
MDPLSIAASVIAVATFAGQVGAAFRSLRQCSVELPGRVHALNNDVADLEVVLYQVASVSEECTRFSERDDDAILNSIEQAHEKLREIKSIIDRLVAASKGTNVFIRASMWRKLHPRLQALQGSIQNTKCSLNLLLGASNSREMLRVRLEVESLSTQTTTSSEEDAAFRTELLATVDTHHEKLSTSITNSWSQVDKRISGIEDLLQTQMMQLESQQAMQMGTMYGLPSGRRRSRPLIDQQAQEKTRRLSNSSALVVRASTQGPAVELFDRVLGQLFVGYAGLPLTSSKCDVATCERGLAPSVSAEYWFPPGFWWSQILRLHVSYQAHLGPQFALSTLRRIPDSAQCVSFALEGNTEGLRDLFRRGLASPKDVSDTRGYSLLRWALYGQQYETCLFLLRAGADPYYRYVVFPFGFRESDMTGRRPIARSDDCPSDKAADIVLRGGISSRVIEIMNALMDGSDFIENQNFQPIHKIVLGLSLNDLEKEVLKDPDEIDVPDALGRTALEWAAARGDHRSVATLLSYGAEPNVMDKKLNTPLTLAANQNQTVCVRLLLEAGAYTDPLLPPDIKFGTPLNCAARNASDPLLLKTLLDFGAHVEACGVDGVTPLLHVARKRGAPHSIILLEYGANINALAKDGRTPLTTAIMFNNHDVLQLLLDRWFDYVECPRLKGPHLLDLAAVYADARTIRILSSSSHLRMRNDNAYVLGEFRERIRDRAGVTTEIIEEFDILLGTLQQPASTIKSPESAMEEGVLSPKGEGSGFDDPDDVFEDAKDSIEPGFEELERAISQMAKTNTS